MFANRFFGNRFFAGRYFPHVGGAGAPVADDFNYRMYRVRRR